MAASLISKVSTTRLSVWSLTSRRALSVGAVLSAKAQPTNDPVKQLFLDKIKEYQSQLAKGGKSPGLRPEDEQQLNNELARLKALYGEGDLTQFPEFNFKEESKIDWR